MGERKCPECAAPYWGQTGINSCSYCGTDFNVQKSARPLLQVDRSGCKRKLRLYVDGSEDSRRAISELANMGEDFEVLHSKHPLSQYFGILPAVPSRIIDEYTGIDEIRRYFLEAKGTLTA